MQTMTIDPNLMMWLFIGMFIIALIAMILSALAIKKKKKLERGDIIRKILKERTKSLKLNAIPGVKDVVLTGGIKEIKRRPGTAWGKYVGSIEWETLTEVLVRRWGKKYYIIVPNEYVSDPNRDHYVLRIRALTFHTWAWVPVVDSVKEQERVFDLTDNWLRILVNIGMRAENKEKMFRGAMEASDATMERVPWRVLERKEEVESDED